MPKYTIQIHGRLSYHLVLLNQAMLGSQAGLTSINNLLLLGEPR